MTNCIKNRYLSEVLRKPFRSYKGIIYKFRKFIKTGVFEVNENNPKLKGNCSEVERKPFRSYKRKFIRKN